ncbi:MAG: HAD family phosphatase [Nanoarchaeota archaeon]
MIKGIIFDMDGVISDTQKLHSKIESQLVGECGVKITPEEITRRYSGRRTREVFEELLKSQGIKSDLDLLMNKKWSQMEKLASESVDAIDGSIELIKRLSSEGYLLAVASASNLNYVQSVLRTLDVIDQFRYIVSGDMVSKGKPDPESFLLAASKINVTPENCLVIEDGRSGMEAAKKGKMFCIGLVKNNREPYPTKYLVTNLSEITPNYLISIINNTQ